jgi:tRNA threonylcarbamoyladenosine biosynthesis protein TsaB
MSNAQSRMKILGIEWSSNKRTIAFGDWSEGEHVRILATAELSGGRDSKYFRAFTDAAEQAGVMKNEIETVVVGLGPGSYAGIRSAISAAYGWHLANDAKLIGIPSDRVLARKTFNDNSINRVHTLVDAQRGECYHALYEKRENGSIEVVQSLSIVNPNELLNPGSVNDVFVGYDIQRWFKGGVSGTVCLLEGYPDAASLLHESENHLSQPGSTDLKPIYLRPTTFVKAPPSRFSLPDHVNLDGMDSES